MLFKKLRTRRKKAKVAADSISGSTYEATITPPLAAISAVVLPVAVARDHAGHLGMQGYAPIVRISKNRRYCEYCTDRVLPSVRHVCWGNVEHHMHTLTHEERTRIMLQLSRKPKKATRAQLKKLYSADRLGPAEIEGQRYGE